MKHTMHWRLPVVLFALAAATSGCALRRQPPVPVFGADAGELDGHWSGEYFSDETNRRGTIELTLRGDGTTAHGSVVMLPVMRDKQDESNNTLAETHPESPHQLSIDFIRVEGNRVNGKLDAYRDPACTCMVTSEFSGTLRGNVINGTFTTTRINERVGVLGRWHVTRGK